MKSLVVLLAMLSIVSCGKDGSDGLRGLQGERGVQGEQGTKGDKGDRGEAGVDGSKVSLVTVCPDYKPTASHKEVLLKIETSTSVEFMAFLANTDFMQERLAIIPVGSGYTTTDGRNASFSIEEVDGVKTLTCNSSSL